MKLPKIALVSKQFLNRSRLAVTKAIPKGVAFMPTNSQSLILFSYTLLK